MADDYDLSLLYGRIDSQKGANHECACLSSAILCLCNQIVILPSFSIRVSYIWNSVLLDL